MHTLLNTQRYEWVGADPLYLAYHDEEWGIPVHDDRCLCFPRFMGGVLNGRRPFFALL